MNKTKYRVECNFGSKYFDDELSAVRYYNKCRRIPMNCELWKINTRSTPTLFSVTQKLLASATFTLVGGVYVES